MNLLFGLMLLLLNPVQVEHQLSNDTKVILDAWIETQNAGTDAAIELFIKTYYTPGVLEKMKNY